MSGNPKQTGKLLISFSGIDGAGKSTQIDNLRTRLEESGRTVQIITFWDDVATLKQFREGVGHKVFKGDKGVGSPEAPIHRRDKNVQSPLVSLSRLALYFGDALSLRSMVRRVTQSNADVVIFDRYLFDELANLKLSSAAIRAYIRSVMKLVPRPDVSFILDADPDAAFARKPEYPLDFLHSNRRAYLTLAEMIGKITIIPPLPIEQAKQAVVAAVFNR
jgi:thymidylate kinase